ncbi:MAG: YabP/YqfC family sporulation protein [Cellulosilyticum sp.]|nr:hypothetical protein [Cellulosilyticum sp.]MEE1072449.1 YabP/YqfC family sporulation protein [Cellulosilyticum sp.]
MKGKRNRNQEGLKKQLTKLLDVPPEVVSDFPQIMISGNQEITVENFGGLLEYTSQTMRLSTKCGILVIHGADLEAQKMTADYITIKGTIIQVGFIV